jgi:hypothetical protein
MGNDSAGLITTLAGTTASAVVAKTNFTITFTAGLAVVLSLADKLLFHNFCF